MEFELLEGEEPLGRLSWKSFCGTHATAECADGAWSFKRVGFLDPRVTVRERGSEEDLAVFRPRFTGNGLLEIRGGPILEWRGTDFFASRWGFFGAGGGPILSVQAAGPRGWKDLLRTGGLVEVGAGGPDLGEFPLCVLLSWYLFVLIQQDTAASSAAVIAAVC
jgi:hypothetical protein